MCVLKLAILVPFDCKVAKRLSYSIAAAVLLDVNEEFLDEDETRELGPTIIELFGFL